MQTGIKSKSNPIIEIDLPAASYYPISLEKIKRRVNKRNGRKKPHFDQIPLFDQFKFPNVKEQVNEYGEKIIRVDGEIPVDLPVESGEHFLFISYSQSALTHGLHKYPAKFFPELPQWLIRRYSQIGEIILDPFAGSGTVNVEAILNRRHSVGIDVDPFSRYLAKVKVTPLSPHNLQSNRDQLISAIIDYSPSQVRADDIPDFPYRDNWFNKEIILELAYIKKIIDQLDTTEIVKDFFRICFSSIIRTVSNADNNCTRTVIRKKLNKKIYPSLALTKFVEAILINVPKMIEFSKKCPEGIKTEFPQDQDARNISFPSESFDLAVTSPPYANAVDYPRTHQLEIYWLGFETGSLTPLKRKHIGTESVSIDDYHTLHKIGIKEADNILLKIYNKDKRRAYIAYKYLEDMKENLSEVYRVLKKGKYYIIVVGNNKIRNELFENWKYIHLLAEEIGFKLETYFASEIINHFIKVPREERINTDWVLVLKKE